MARTLIDLSMPVHNDMTDGEADLVLAAIATVLS